MSDVKGNDDVDASDDLEPAAAAGDAGRAEKNKEMEEEIMLAHRIGIPVIYIDAKPEQIIGIFDMINQKEKKN